MTARKLDEYLLDDQVEVAVAFGTKDVAWWPGRVIAIRHHREGVHKEITLTVKAADGGTWTLNTKNAHIIRYPNDAILIGTEVECRKDGKTWERGVVTSQVSDHVSYWVKHHTAFRHWPADKVRLPLPPPVRSADDLAKELEEAKKRNAHMEAEWHRIIEVNGKFIAEANAAQSELAKIRDINDKLVAETNHWCNRATTAEAEVSKVTHEAGKLRAEAARLSGVESAIESWRERAVKAEKALSDYERKQSDVCRRSFKTSYELGQARAELEEVKEELAKVKAAHADTTKAHFEASYNLGKERADRIEVEKALAAETEHCKGLRDAFRDALAKKNEEVDRLKRAVAECAKVNVESIDKLQAAIKRAETAEKALAERAGIYGTAHDAAIADIEAMWRRKFEALDRRLGAAEACRDSFLKRAQAAEAKITNARAKLEE